MAKEWLDDAEDPGPTVHGRHLVSSSPLQRRVDATWARLRGIRASVRRDMLRASRIQGRRPQDQAENE